jgi:hypothetical protein
VDGIVAAELGKREKFIPIILAFINPESYVLLQFLVNTFSLAIRLWMIGS